MNKVQEVSQIVMKAKKMYYRRTYEESIPYKNTYNIQLKKEKFDIITKMH